MCGKQVLILDPFYGGSHKQLTDIFCDLYKNTCDLYTMTAKKWHWRNLTSSLYFSQVIPKNHDYRILFTSSVLPLADLVALRNDLSKMYKVVYFHENQLVYPVQEKKERYFQHVYNDILTCLVADKILFNSRFNRDSLLKNLSSRFNILPDFKPNYKNIEQQILEKSDVVYFPICVPLRQSLQTSSSDVEGSSTHLAESNPNAVDEKLHIIWPHRWEHDKDPETFFSVIYRLKDCGAQFKLSVVGESFKENPKIFDEAAEYLKDHIVSWGYQPQKSDYYDVLRSADVVVSTAVHEFFGVSMLEATSLNCYPLCPNRLVYPELYPDQYLYNTPNQLFKRLKYFCKCPSKVRTHKIQVDLQRFSLETLREQYKNVFAEALQSNT